MRYANIWQRIGAFLLDYLVIAAYIALLVIIGVGLGFGPLRGVFQAMFADPNISELSAFLLLVLPVILYFALFQCSSWQATPGKRKMGLRVIATHGTRLSFPRSFVRSLLQFVPWELTHACLWRIPGWPLAPTTPSPIITAGLVLVWVLVGANLLSILVSKKHQALYDWISGTAVIVVQHPVRPAASEKH
ncbi:MAG TPA: RDD family protein [Ktedonobacteraceae bacterium]|nr:RDD family protein [Ktedonobacteraceae bacterium]